MPDFINIDQSRPVCAKLKTKALYVYGQNTADMFRTSRSGGYQCLETCFVTGPDGALVAPEECQPGRPCFVPR